MYNACASSNFLSAAVYAKSLAARSVRNSSTSLLPSSFNSCIFLSRSRSMPITARSCASLLLLSKRSFFSTSSVTFLSISATSTGAIIFNFSSLNPSSLKRSMYAPCDWHNILVLSRSFFLLSMDATNSSAFIALSSSLNNDSMSLRCMV